MKMLTVLVAAALLAAPTFAADSNTALFRGRVTQVREHYTSGGLFRIEVQLFTQAPAGGPYSPIFTCSPLIWSDCEVTDLITGCTTTETSQAGPDDTKITIHHCFPFNPEAGVCLETSPFHDGFSLLSDAVTIVANSNCTAIP